ncbi:hypothetical protein BDFB_000882 [Asbolus verrucosus]|uniref:Uncharacterized protein n=1 Tax=Asbolus verrucosus TaxID=1661398 RepID=A0A482VS47_ASBVE|nr:hypothetical protein BDFB_000882 [Asbolus verrucosus]
MADFCLYNLKEVCVFHKFHSWIWKPSANLKPYETI